MSDLTPPQSAWAYTEEWTIAPMSDPNMIITQFEASMAISATRSQELPKLIYELADGRKIQVINNVSCFEQLPLLTKKEE